MEAEKIYKYLPAGILWLISSLPHGVQSRINEIRLRRGGLMTVSLAEKNLVIESGGSAYVCTDRDIDETLEYISRSSMYAYDEAVKNGYIPLEGGGRAGICGDAVIRGGKISAFGSINSICLRVPRFYKSIAKPLIEYYQKNGLQGTLVFSPPGVGKTTYLKSAGALLSEVYRVGIVDERYELSGGIYAMADICTGCTKAEGIELLTRTMSPQVIICDEVSGAEADGIQNAQNSGCVLVASCHAATLEQLMKRDFVKRMTDKGVFSLAVRLYYDGGYGSELIVL